MRVLGMTEKWPKLQKPEFTTFRFSRHDKDWAVGEQVQVVYKPRRKGGGEPLGIAEIIGKYAVMIFSVPPPDPISPIGEVSQAQALEDGFEGKCSMQLWMWHTYKRRAINEPVNKLTLRWIRKDE